MRVALPPASGRSLEPAHRPVGKLLSVLVPRNYLVIGDRHRDYELVLSGYTVLRLANDEVLQDFGRAVEKIRDVVRLRRALMKQEA